MIENKCYGMGKRFASDNNNNGNNNNNSNNLKNNNILIFNNHISCITINQPNIPMIDVSVSDSEKFNNLFKSLKYKYTYASRGNLSAAVVSSPRGAYRRHETRVNPIHSKTAYNMVNTRKRIHNTHT